MHCFIILIRKISNYIEKRDSNYFYLVNLTVLAYDFCMRFVRIVSVRYFGVIGYVISIGIILLSFIYGEINLFGLN